METIVLGNFVGKKVTDLKEVASGMAANMEFCNRDGYGYGNVVEDEDGNEVELTDAEVIKRIQTDLSEGFSVYMGMYIDAKKYAIYPAKAMTMQTDFHIGQKVYTMIDNKITEVTIVNVNLSIGNDNELTYALYSVAEKLYYSIGFMFTNSVDSPLPSEKARNIIGAIKKYAMGNSAIVSYLKGGYAIYKAFPITEVFATKEELVKHLLED